jgi:hypothetical protein
MVWEKEVISSHMWPADPSGRKWTSDRFREALKRESRIGLGLELTYLHATATIRVRLAPNLD